MVVLAGGGSFLLMSMVISPTKTSMENDQVNNQ